MPGGKIADKRQKAIHERTLRAGLAVFPVAKRNKGQQCRQEKNRIDEGDQNTDTGENSQIGHRRHLGCRKRQQTAGRGDIRHDNRQAGMPQGIGDGCLLCFQFRDNAERR